jgi:hypothetical protein
LLDQPRHPQVGVGVHDDHQRKQRRHAGLHQQRNVLDDDRVFGHRRNDLRAPLAHQRMNDAVEGLACLVVLESLGGQRRPVQCAVGREDVVAEGRDQRRQPLGTRFDHLARDDVGVDDDATALREGRRHRRLTGADAAGEPDPEHVAPSGAAGQLLPQRRELGVAGQ